MNKWIRRIKRFFCKKDKRISSEKSEHRNADYLYDVMSGEILNYVRQTFRLPSKTLQVVLVDEAYEGTQLVLQKIYPNLNYLTVVTKHPELFYELAEKICYDTGLQIGFTDRIPQEADIILEPCRYRLQVGGDKPEFIDYNHLGFCLDGVRRDSLELQSAIWGEETLDLRQFGDGEIPEEYRGRIDISSSKRV